MSLIYIDSYKSSFVPASVSLNGSSQYLTVSTGAYAELTTFSLVCWVYIDSVSGNGKICNYLPKGAHANGRGWQMEYNSSTIRALFGDADGSWGLVTSGTISNSTWYCCVFTYNGTTGELFINNSSQGTFTDGITYTDGGGTWPYTKHFWLGATDTNTGGMNAGYYFDGLQTGFAIFNIALNSDQRNLIYNGGHISDYSRYSFYSNCVIYLPFNNSYKDYKNNYNATPVNSPTFSAQVP